MFHIHAQFIQTCNFCDFWWISDFFSLEKFFDQKMGGKLAWLPRWRIRFNSKNHKPTNIIIVTRAYVLSLLYARERYSRFMNWQHNTIITIEMRTVSVNKLLLTALAKLPVCMWHVILTRRSLIWQHLKLEE